MKAPRAFTLVELLLATVLTTMLMIGVMAVVARLGAAAGGPAQPQALEGRLDDSTAECALRLLRDDLDLATTLDGTRPGELALTGFVALDPRDRQRTQRPARVVYQVVSIDGRGWLIRTETVLDAPAGQKPQQDLVCAGVTRFELVKAPGTANVSASQASALIPTTWRLRIWSSNQAEPAFDRVVVVRGATGT